MSIKWREIFWVVSSFVELAVPFVRARVKQRMHSPQRSANVQYPTCLLVLRKTEIRRKWH